jgi:hypothetical protein
MTWTYERYITMKTEINTDGSLLTFKHDELKDGTAFKNWIMNLDLDNYVRQFSLKMNYYNDSFGNDVFGYVMPDGYMLDFVEMLIGELPNDNDEENCVIIDRFLCELGIKNAFLMYHDSNISVLPFQDELKELDMTTDEGMENLFKGVLMYLIENADGVAFIEEADYKQHKWEIDEEDEEDEEDE